MAMRTGQCGQKSSFDHIARSGFLPEAFVRHTGDTAKAGGARNSGLYRKGITMTGINQPPMSGKTGFITAMRNAPKAVARKAKERACMIDATIRLQALEPQKGAATAEYAMVLVAACGFAAVLFAVIKSDAVKNLVIALIKGALELKKA